MPLRAKNGKWHYRFKLNGESITGATDLAATDANRTRAEKAEKARRDAILKGAEPAKRQRKRGFTEASEDFMQAVRVDHRDKPNTIRRIETSLASLRVYFGGRHVSAIRPADVQRYKVWRLSGDEHISAVQPVTVRHDLDALSKFFRWAITDELCTCNPVAAVDKPSTEDAVRMHIVTPAEEMEYFARCDARGYRNLSDVARLILEQGCRPDEVMRLERSAVDLERGRITVAWARRGKREGKTSAARRTLKLTPAARAIVERRMLLAGRWLFPSPKRPGEPLTKLNGPHDKVCAMAPALPIVLYDFRHTFATRAVERGMSLPVLAAVLGHSSLRMVTKYVHPQQEHMDAEMMRISSPAVEPATEKPARAERVQ